jgi:hypothetical protein
MAHLFHLTSDAATPIDKPCALPADTLARVADFDETLIFNDLVAVKAN